MWLVVVMWWIAIPNTILRRNGEFTSISVKQNSCLTVLLLYCMLFVNQKIMVIVSQFPENTCFFSSISSHVVTIIYVNFYLTSRVWYYGHCLVVFDILRLTAVLLLLMSDWLCLPRWCICVVANTIVCISCTQLLIHLCGSFEWS